MDILIRGGRVHDPANGIDGAVKDIAVSDGVIVDAGDDFRPGRTIDAAGCVVLPGGVDVHCHIAGPSVNRARRLTAADGPPVARRAALDPRSGGILPSTFVTGYRYAALGYTTAVEAAVAPSSARQCHLELRDTPNIDRGFLLLLANHELLLDLIARGEREAARDTALALLSRTGAFGIKSLNAGGVSLWKRESAHAGGVDQVLGGRGLTPRAILETLADAAEAAELPHPVHIHASRLGEPGNIETTIETSRALTGRRRHLTHVQFHAYGQDGDGRHESAALRLVEHLKAEPDLTMDVGQVMFGDAVTLSADLALEHTLWQLTGKRSASIEVELETGCGVVPFRYAPGSRLHSLQFAVGLEILLHADDPWRLALSTDHPNGASFLAYPGIIALLMSRDVRAEALRAIPPAVLASTTLRDLDREYTLGEIAIITRAGPARMLGLAHKGHLGPGADADITIYDDGADREAMFRSPRWVLKAGEIVAEKGELRAPAPGETFRADLPAAPVPAALTEWFERHGSYRLAQLGPREDEVASLRAVERPEPAETALPPHGKGRA